MNIYLPTIFIFSRIFLDWFWHRHCVSMLVHWVARDARAGHGALPVAPPAWELTWRFISRRFQRWVHIKIIKHGLLKKIKWSMFNIKKTKLNEPSTAGIRVCLVIFLVLVLMISRNAAGFLKVQWASGCGTFVDLDSVIRLLVSLISLLPSSLCQRVNKPGNGHSLAKHLLEMEIRRLPSREITRGYPGWYPKVVHCSEAFSSAETTVSHSFQGRTVLKHLLGEWTRIEQKCRVFAGAEPMRNTSHVCVVKRLQTNVDAHSKKMQAEFPVHLAVCSDWSTAQLQPAIESGGHQTAYLPSWRRHVFFLPHFSDFGSSYEASQQSWVH